LLLKTVMLKKQYAKIKKLFIQITVKIDLVKFAYVLLMELSTKRFLGQRDCDYLKLQGPRGLMVPVKHW
jgi:hypothetical protein